jgi:hypothetical protein
VLRYGLFQIGDRWCVASDDNTRMDFASFPEAVSAADLLIHAHRACGDACEVVMPDRNSRLVSLPEGEPGALGVIAEEIITGARPSPWLS